MVELARQRLLARLDEPFPLMILEGLPGAGKRTLLRQWTSAPAPRGRRRALVALDPRQPTQTAVLLQILRAVGEHGVPVPESAYQRVVSASGRGLDVLEAVLSSRNGIELAVVGYDRLPPDAFSGLAALHRRVPGLRVLMDTTDATVAIRRAAADGLPLATIGDDELAFDLEEITTLVASLGGEPAPGAAEALLGATRGHVGTTLAVLATSRHDVLSGTITRARALQHWWAGRDDPSPFERHLLLTAAIPRFTATQARAFTGSRRVDEDTDRMVRLGMGELRGHRYSAEPAFVWEEEARQAVLRVAARSELPSDARPDCRALADSAHRAGDLQLAAAALVLAGDLDAAEAAVRLSLDEALNEGDLALWGPLLQLPSATVERHPALSLLRSLLGRRAGTATPHLTSGLARFATQLAGRAAAEPLERLWLLALAARAAVEAGETAAARDHALRWGRVAADVRELLVGRASAAAAMAAGVIEVLVRLDELPAAVWAADLVIDALEGRSGDVPSTDSRYATALLTRRCVAAVHGENTAAAHVLPPPGHWSELDEVLSCVHRAWEALDGGELEAADRITRAGMSRCPEPRAWPVLLLTRVVALLGVRRLPALERLARRQLGSADRRCRQADPSGDVAVIVDTLVALALGRGQGRVQGPPPAPGSVLALVRNYLDNDPRRVAPAELDGLPPRVRNLALGLEALAVLRAGAPELAAQTYALVCSELPAGGMLPLAFAFAEPDEVDRLARAHAHRSPRCRRQLAFARRVAHTLPSGVAAVVLSERERELLAQLRRGATTQEIADAWVVSVNTVKFHRSNLYRKLGVAGRDEALAAALRLGY